MKVYDTNHNLIESFQAHTNIIRRIKQSPFNNQYVASCSEDNTVKIWNKWNLIQTYTKHTDYVNDLEWISKEAIASGSNDNTIQIWSLIPYNMVRVDDVSYSICTWLKLSFQS